MVILSVDIPELWPSLADAALHDPATVLPFPILQTKFATKFIESTTLMDQLQYTVPISRDVNSDNRVRLCGPCLGPFDF